MNTLSHIKTLEELNLELFLLRNPTAPTLHRVHGEYVYYVDYERTDVKNLPNATEQSTTNVSLPVVIPKWHVDAHALLHLILDQSISVRISPCKDATYITARSPRYDTRKRIDVALDTSVHGMQYTYALAVLRCCIAYQQAIGVPATNRDVVLPY